MLGVRVPTQHAIRRDRAVVARKAHDLEVGGSNPSPATVYHKKKGCAQRRPFFCALTPTVYTVCLSLANTLRLVYPGGTLRFSNLRAFHTFLSSRRIPPLYKYVRI